MKVLVIGLIIFLLLSFILIYLIGGKLDWTKDKELLLWYWEVEDGIRKRKYITIFKL